MFLQKNHNHKQKKIKVLLFLALVGLFYLPLVVLGKQQKLEVEYPRFPSIQAPEYVNFPIQNYLAYIYELTIALVGILCVLILVLGGVQYLRAMGNPSLLLRAKRKILSSILGLAIVFSAFLIASTINPQLVKFPYHIIEPFKATFTEKEVDYKKTLVFQEIPIGTLITSEIGASAYMYYLDKLDISIDRDDYLDYFLKVPYYSTPYQGLLHGRRLMRVNEVGLKTHDNFATPLFYLSRSLVRTAYTCCCNAWENQEKKIETTESGLCKCKTPDTEDAPPCQTECKKPICKPEGKDCKMIEPCHKRVCTEFNEKRIECLQKAIQVLIECYRAFLDADYLVQDAFRSRSWLLSEVTHCYSQGYITEEEYNNWLINPIMDAIQVENKGTVSPITHERDVETNIHHLKLQFDRLVEAKEMLDPLAPRGCQPQPISLNQMYQLINMPQKTVLKKEEVEISHFRKVETVGEDPAAFYCSFEPLYTSLELIKILSETSESPIRCKGQSVEIPIGKAVDEALKLGDDLIRRLTQIWETGHHQIKLAEELIKIPDPLLKPPRPADNCNIFCQSKCRCVSRDEDGNCIRCRSYTCTDKGKLAQIKEALVQKLLEIQEDKRKICRYWTKIRSFEPCALIPPKKTFIYSERCCEKKTCEPCEDSEIKKRKYSTFEKLATVQKLLNISRSVGDFKLLVKQLQEVENNLHKMRMKSFELAEYPEEYYRMKEVSKSLKNCDNLIIQLPYQKEGKEEFNLLQGCYMTDYLNTINFQEECNPHPAFDCEFFNYDSRKPHPTDPLAEPVSNECVDKKRSSYLCYCFGEETTFGKLSYQHDFFFEPGNNLSITSNFFCCINAQTPFVLNP